MRTGNEKKNTTIDDNHQLQLSTISQPQQPSSLTLADYDLQGHELQSFFQVQKSLNLYILCHNAMYSSSCSSTTFLNLQDFFSILSTTHTEKSKYIYEEVMDAVADNKATITQLLQSLHQKYIVDRGLDTLVIEGDVKVYEILQSLKFEYGNDLEWVIPYPGDWHLLKNYQLPLMKAYFDGGLKSLAKLAGYPVASIQACTQFKRCHHFILESWEAMYRAMIKKYIEYDNTTDTLESLSLFLHSLSTDNFIQSFNDKLIELDDTITTNFERFTEFLQLMANNDDTCIWRYCVFEDALPYIGLFLALRSGDWDLRIASLKQMAPVFTIFNHKTCQKVISQHLTNLLQMPNSIIGMFKQGAFVVNIKGRPWHAVAIDEAHEMLINKACKTAIVKPNPDYIKRLTTYLPYRSRSIQNISRRV